MCIRDRCKEVCTHKMGVHGTYTLEQTGGKAVCIYCGQCANVCPVDSITEPVSYTHLDVYKRQLRACSISCWCEARMFSLLLMSPTAAGMSLTSSRLA